MICVKSPLCHFFQKRSTAALAPAEWDAVVTRFCGDNSVARSCAIYQVMDRLGFLRCPRDLQPADTARAACL